MTKENLAGFYLAMDWLNGALQSGFITKSEYEEQKEILFSKLNKGD